MKELFESIVNTDIETFWDVAESLLVPCVEPVEGRVGVRVDLKQSHEFPLIVLHIISPFRVHV